MFYQFLSYYSKTYPSKSMITPKIIITDWSTAIIGALIRVYDMCSMKEYLHKCLRYLVDGASRNESCLLPDLLVYICSAHLLHRCKKEVKNSESANFCLCVMAYMIQCTRLDQLIIIAKKVKLIMNTKIVTNEVLKEHALVEKLLNRVDTRGITEEALKVEIDDATVLDIEGADEIEEEIHTSTFAIYWNTILAKENGEEDLSSDDQEDGAKLNYNYNPHFYEKLEKHYLPSCPLWTKIVVGEISRSFDSDNFGENVHTVKDVVNTNTYAEEFFRIKKRVSFLNTNKLPLHRFIEINYADNEQIYHTASAGILKELSSVKKRKK